MALPKLEVPKYMMTVPSTGDEIEFRPFLVREEKILVIAMESEDMKQITDAVIDILNSCILTRGVKVDQLSTFDIEYLFLNIRSKSVGETVEVNVTCPDDGETQVQMEINVDDIKMVKNKKHKNIIKLDDTLSLKLRYPSMNQFVENNFETSESTSEIDRSLDMIITCVDTVFDEEESWSASDCTKKELREFIEQLNSKQFKDIEAFFTTMPKLSHTIKVKNPNTGVESEVVLEGLASFFS